jgi:hypothetical protein
MLLFSLFSCKKDKKKEEIEKIIGKWIGKEIVFPANDEYQVIEKDSSISYESLFDKEYKILFYSDTTGCTDCKLRLFQWKFIMEDLDSISGRNVGFLFFLFPKNIEEIRLIMERYDFNYPVFIDSTNKIGKLNHFPIGQTVFQCFLLDRDNKVLSVGNPVEFSQIHYLYNRTIHPSRLFSQKER